MLGSLAPPRLSLAQVMPTVKSWPVKFLVRSLRAGLAGARVTDAVLEAVPGPASLTARTWTNHAAPAPNRPGRVKEVVERPLPATFAQAADCSPFAVGAYRYW